MALVGIRAYADIVEVNVPSNGFPVKGGCRGEVKTFSAASRRRLMRTVAKLRDLDSGYFVTVTYGDDVPGDWKVWKTHLAALRKRLARFMPGAGGIWRFEPQVRKSGKLAGQIVPHFHLLLVNARMPHDHFRKYYAKFRHFHELAVKRYGVRRASWAQYAYLPAGGNPDIALRVWLRVSWWEVVTGLRFDDSIDIQHPAISYLFANGQCDPVKSRRHAGKYVSKYLAKVSPVELPVGRYWGVFGGADFSCYQYVMLLDWELPFLRRLMAAFLKSKKSVFHRYVKATQRSFSVFGLGYESNRASPEPTVLRMLRHACGVLGGSFHGRGDESFVSYSGVVA